MDVGCDPCGVGGAMNPYFEKQRGQRGPEHHAWLGDAVGVKGGRTRALRMYPEIGPCANCGGTRAERHHRNGNTADNSPENIGILCRRCHMAEDGRLEAFKAKASLAASIANSRRWANLPTACKNGHPFEPGSFRIRPGSNTRLCHQCELDAKHRYRARGGK